MSESLRVLWSPAALEDLTDTLQYVASDSGLDLALALQARVEQRVATLTRHARRCRIVPELKALGIDHYRELIVGPHRVFFRIDGEVVGITACLDGRRDLDEILLLRGLTPRA